MTTAGSTIRAALMVSGAASVVTEAGAMCTNAPAMIRAGLNFDIPGMNSPDDRNMSRLIDAQLSLPLAKLPSTVVAPTQGAIVALAERNLLRGKRLCLPDLAWGFSRLSSSYRS